ncbi:hypothetical protein V502_02410, partial [Pseudogymnoascus sp. VKM F-4520 (FW-2644)]
KLAQLMVVQEAYKQRQEQICTYQSEMTEVEAQKKATSYYRLVKQFVAQFTTMAHSSRNPTPMQWIYQTCSYRFKIQYTTPAAGKIQWIQDKVLYPSTHVQMLQLQSMVHGLIGEAQDKLFGKLMVVTDKGGVPSINWDNTVDQLLETKVGWSFLDNERNKFGAHKEWWLFERIYQEQALQEQFLDNNVFGVVVDIDPFMCWAAQLYNRDFEVAVEEYSQQGHTKRHHRERWTGLEREGGMKRGKGKKGARGEKEKTQEEEKGQRTKLSWTSKRSILSISAWRQIAIAISQRFCWEFWFEDESRKWDPNENWDKDNVAGNDLWDLQARHGTHIAGMIYACKLMEGNNTIISRWEKFQQGNATHGTKRKRPSFEDEMDKVQAQQWKKLQTVDIQQALEEMFRAGTQFCGLQKPALEAIMKHKSPILVVMGTSVWKSMLFQIPAKSVSSRTTIVITLLVLLQDHMVEQCQQVGILCTKWDSQRMGEMQAQIVIVTPESAVSKAFSTFLNDVQGRWELVCIVFDECHTVIDSTPDFQPQMQQLGALSTQEVQMVFLTATLPKHTEPEFMQIMKIKLEEVQTFRGPTTQPNIAYSIHEYAEESNETEAICQLVGEKLEQYAAPAKIIVYGGTIERTQELSKALGCHHWQAGGVAEEDSTGQSADTTVEDPESRDVAIARWTTDRIGKGEVGEEQCDVCKKDDAMVEDREAQRAAYIEEQRANREQAAQAECKSQGQWVDSRIDVPSSSMSIPALSSEVLVPRSVVVTSPQPFTDQDITSSEEEGQPIPQSRCSSVSFDKGFAADQDPVSKSCTFEAQNQQQSQQQWRVEADSQQEGHEVWNLENQLDSWVGKCLLCYTRQCQGWEVDVQHTLENCPDESQTKVIMEIEALKTVQFELQRRKRAATVSGRLKEEYVSTAGLCLSTISG